jgi:hypothetical protein
VSAFLIHTGLLIINHNLYAGRRLGGEKNDISKDIASAMDNARAAAENSDSDDE